MASDLMKPTGQYHLQKAEMKSCGPQTGPDQKGSGYGYARLSDHHCERGIRRNCRGFGGKDDLKFRIFSWVPVSHGDLGVFVEQCYISMYLLNSVNSLCIC